MRNYSFAGKTEAGQLLAFLNDKRTQKDRVLRVLLGIQELEQAAAPTGWFYNPPQAKQRRLPKAVEYSPEEIAARAKEHDLYFADGWEKPSERRYTDPSLPEPDMPSPRLRLMIPAPDAAKQCRKLLSEVNDILADAEHGIRPQLLNLHSGGWSLFWTSGTGKAKKSALAEANALGQVLELATMGCAGHVRRCDYKKCRRWFYAVKSFARFCPDTDHRQKFHEAVPGRAKQRAEAQKQRRLIAKQREMEQRKAEKIEKIGRRKAEK